MENEPDGTSRRSFLRHGSGAVAAVTLGVPGILRRAFPSPNEQVDIAFIGVGGRGGANLGDFSKMANVVALCDVDASRGGKGFERFPQASRHQDFRRMLDKVESSIDAVSISTPDHTHAVAAMGAIERGKHVYCEKPLAHSIGEVRALMKASKEKGVVTQLGNQGHSFEDIRKLVEWVRAGAIGNVHTIHAGCSAYHSKIQELPRLEEKHDVPKGLDWDLWLGPAAARPYHPVYAPKRWRGWKPFGSGTIGDWVCHVVDPSFWALELGAPRSVEAVELRGYDPVAHADTFPPGSILRFEFPAKGERGPVALYFHGGEARIPRPVELRADREMIGAGAVLQGDSGVLLHGSHGARGVELLPEDAMRDYEAPAPSIPRVESHRHDFLAAIRDGRKAGSDFHDYGGPLTEIALLGVIAMNFPGRKLTWDSEATRFTDCDAANAYIQPAYRDGWKL